MSEILQELREEHQKLLRMLEEGDILEVIEFVEGVHHPKEEQLLFPLMAPHPLLKQGGPRCMYFKGLAIELQIYRNAQKALKDYHEQGGPKAPEYQDFDWLLDGNPLNVPMYEHHLGHELAHGIRWLSTQKDSPLHDPFYSVFCDEYVKLLRLHIEKEDSCLFVIAENMLKRKGA